MSNHKYKLILKPIWKKEDRNYDWFFFNNLGKHISLYFMSEFQKYGKIIEFETCLDKKFTDFNIFFVITYQDSNVVSNILNQKNDVDYLVEFLTFDVYANVESYEENHDDFTLLYFNNKH